MRSMSSFGVMLALRMNSSAQRSTHFCRSFGSFRFEKTMILARRSHGWARIVWRTSKPFIPGIMISRSMRSGSALRRLDIAARPSYLTMTWYPASSSLNRYMSESCGLSSTIIIVFLSFMEKKTESKSERERLYTYLFVCKHLFVVSCDILSCRLFDSIEQIWYTSISS